MSKLLLPKTVQVLLLVILTIIIAYIARDFLIPVALAGLLAMLVMPVGTWLERKGWTRGLASLACVLLLLGVLAGIITLLSWQMSTFTEDFTQIKAAAFDKLE